MKNTNGNHHGNHPGGDYINFMDTPLDGKRIHMNKEINEMLNQRPTNKYICYKAFYPRKHLLIVPEIDQEKALSYLKSCDDKNQCKEHNFIKKIIKLSKDGRFSFPEWLLRHIDALNRPSEPLAVFVREKLWIEVYKYDVAKDLF
jgi:hypothetical protein